MMLFRQLFDYDTWTYTYLIADTTTAEAALVDPVIENVERDWQILRELGLTLRYCLETHVHADHITGTGTLRAKLGCQGLVPAGANAACADRYLADGETLMLGSIPIVAIATPGHTDSHMAYYINRDRVLTGDALLIRGCGRTDFQSGDAATLYHSVTEKLFNLPDDTLVYPGHDYRGRMVSTVAEEKRYNPRFVDVERGTLRDRDAYVQIMTNLNLPQPAKIMEAVPANEKCGNVPSLV